MGTVLATSFAFGMVATVNPCGFAMLPAYVSSFLTVSDEQVGSRLRRALRVSALVTAGFVVVFGAAGVLISAGVRAIVEWVPWLAVVVGGALVIVGVRTVRGRPLAIHLGSGRVDRRSVFAFGVSYAIASLSCTLPIFLALVAGTFTQTSFTGGVLAFVAYGLGTGLVLTALTVGMAFGEDRLAGLIRRAARWVPAASGAVLIGSGLFIVWYWTTVLRGGIADLGARAAVRWVDTASSTVTSFVADRPLLVAVVAAVVVSAGVLRARRPRAGAPEQKVADR